MKMMNAQHKIADDEISANAFFYILINLCWEDFCTKNCQSILALQYQIKYLYLEMIHTIFPENNFDLNAVKV